jgi:hypothetical protein
MIDGDELFAITFSLIGASAAVLVAGYVYYVYNKHRTTTDRGIDRESEIIKSMYDGLID